MLAQLLLLLLLQLNAAAAAATVPALGPRALLRPSVRKGSSKQRASTDALHAQEGCVCVRPGGKFALGDVGGGQGGRRGSGARATEQEDAVSQGEGPTMFPAKPLEVFKAEGWSSPRASAAGLRRQSCRDRCPFRSCGGRSLGVGRLRLPPAADLPPVHRLVVLAFPPRRCSKVGTTH